MLATWPDSLTYCIVVWPLNWTIPQTDMAARKRELTEDIIPVLEKATAGSVTYLNEGFLV
jgi:hypothetical protein